MPAFGSAASSSSSLGQSNSRLQELNDEIEALDEQIKDLQAVRQRVVAERNKLASKSKSFNGQVSQASGSNNSVSGSIAQEFTDYFSKRFSWTPHLLSRAQKVWKIREFRSVQEAVCNAALDARDVVCVMPTGGGKSLCYQLPAVLSKGLTIVVSPLISLSMDQMWHLREVGVACEMLYHAATREEGTDILRRIKSEDSRDDIKVLFVTPERIAKSKSLLAALQKAYEQDRLARIVIDEAHCCSQQGHDFRPDYKNLSILRKVFPEVPFLCLSATLAPSVLEDVRRILSLESIVDPAKAPPKGTVYFTAPLHRPNLHYEVINRPAASKESNQAITDWILQHHPGQSGIVYTFSKKETHVMAEALSELSKGKIRAAVYHADLEDQQKTNVHCKWRQGSIEVVVATIAFGMGIDKGDVRFVIHASLGTSLDSYYQETGRAGRDGKQADCILFYRPADATRISSLLANDSRGKEKLHSMLTYAQSSDCRKAIFGNYFADRYGVSGTCGACDNCLLPVPLRDVTMEAWKIARILEEVYEESGRVTLANLGDLCRGLGGGQYTVVETQQRRRKKQRVKGKQSGFIDIKNVVGEKIKLSKEDTERVLVEMLMRGFLDDEYNATAYSVNVYVKPGIMSGRLTRLSQEDVEAKVKGCPTVFVKLLDMDTKKISKKRSKKAKANEDEIDDSEDESSLSENDIKSSLPKRSAKSASASASASTSTSNGSSRHGNKKRRVIKGLNVLDDDIDEDDLLEEDLEEVEIEDLKSTGNMSMSSNKHDPIEIDSD